MKSKVLTGLELKVMNILWDCEAGFVKEIIERWQDEPIPAYNTVSTIVRILEEKGFVGHEAFGRSHRYFPTISRSKYRKSYLKNVVDNVFAGSLSNLVSTMVDNKELSREQLEDLKRMIDEKIEE